jgi:hypothetical protein
MHGLQGLRFRYIDCAHGTALRRRAKNNTTGVQANWDQELVDSGIHHTVIITFIHGLIASITKFPLGLDSVIDELW